MRKPKLLLRQYCQLLCCLMCFNCLIVSSLRAQNDTSSKNKNCLEIIDGFFIGPSTIFENGGDFNTFGLNSAYTHRLKGRIGVTGDAGVHFGSQGNTKYTKLQLLAGVSLLPVANNTNKATLSPHLLVGVSNVSSKFSYNSTSFTNSNTGFALAAGTDVAFPIGRTTAAARVDYNPTFSSGGTSSNFRISVGVNIPLGCGKGKENCTTCAPFVCKASKNTTEFKTKLPIENIAQSIEEVANKIPRVEAKVALNAQVTVKQGEECCSPDKPPASYTEIKGGYEVSFEINFNLWGIPDINYSLKLWPVLLIAEFKCKLFAGPTGKLSAERVGRNYGTLLTGEKRPDCPSCVYDNLKAEGSVRLGVKAGGSLKLFHWSPFGEGKAGFNVTGPPDEQLELSAEAAASVSTGFNGTYTKDVNCKKPEQGLHGTFNFGKGKINLKFNVKLGPISFDPSYEFLLWEGLDYKF